MNHAFSVNDLRYKYPTAKGDMLKGITFSVEEGEIFGFLGPSGAGKSTTQKILIKLLEGYSGEIRYFDRDLKTMDKSYTRMWALGLRCLSTFPNDRAGKPELFAGFYKNKIDFRELMERVGCGSTGIFKSAITLKA